MIIKALGLLNQRLKQQQSNKTLSIIFWVPMQQYGIRLDVLENKNYYMHIKNYVSTNSPEILKKITYDFISKKDNTGDLLTESLLKNCEKYCGIFKSWRTTIIYT